MRGIWRVSALALTAALQFPAIASADFINVIAATQSSSSGGGALETANGSGFTPDPTPGSILGSHIANIGTHWLSATRTSPLSAFFFEYTYYKFASIQSIEKIRFWNYNDATNISRGVKNLIMHVSSNADAFGVSTHASWTELANISNIPQGPGNPATLYGQEFDVPDTEALVVRFLARESHGNVNNIGFAETRFVTTATVPEPSSLLLMMTAGLISLSTHGRRRR